MSGKIGKVIIGLRKKLEEANQKLHTDPLTGLGGRERFESEIKQMYMASSSGHVFFARIDALGAMAKERSEGEEHAFIKSFAAEPIRAATAACEGGKAFRFVEALAELGRLLDIRIVAESVRTNEDLEAALFGASRGKQE